MSATDRERWDARHAAVGVGAPMPPDGLRGRLGLLPGGGEPRDRSGLPAGGRALDVACGRGAVAVWLAHQGFTVDAVDVSGAGLASARALAAAEGVGNVRGLEADLEAGLPLAGPYDLVVCQRYRDPALYPALAAALVPGGLLVLTVLSEVGDEGGRFRAVPGELARAFPQLEILDHREGDGEATLLARRP
ncbi:class I SAM-dependent methyltransferase [Pseudonocardia halophobica]|uniref:class I SAM-dependent methyltransferase n=1 Tax=Pseudonocardia halophobica TaxID=29401 RepID=UPI003D93523B